MKIIWIILVVILSACTVTKPHVSEYILTPKIADKKKESQLCKVKSLKVGQVFSSNSLMSKKMKYIELKYKESSFTQSQWARTPNRAISDALVKSIRNTQLFANVSTYKSRARTDWLLETNVEKFMQYFEEENEKSYVRVVLTLNILNMKDSKNIGHATFSTKIDTQSADAKGGVVALNSALAEVLDETNIWLNGVCK